MKNKPRILIVDDNADLLDGLKLFLKPHASEITTYRNPNLIPATLQQKTYDLILLDMNFSAGVNSGNEGLYWMRRILEYDPEATLVLITGYGDIDIAVQAMKEGAADFIQKSWDEERILSSLMAALRLRESRLEIRSLQNRTKHLEKQIAGDLDICYGNSPAMRKVFQTLEKVAVTDANVLILGENGTGKEIAARELHRLSQRSTATFVTVDMASLPESLFESELFGYKKGAFTDAFENKTGYLEIADGGTLFLDEIGNLSLMLQAKILSVLQNREFTPLGSVRKIPVDIRIISATNKDLEAMVEEGTFRQDLLYRINTIQVEIPPLRERKEDIPGLAAYFLKKYNARYCRNIKGFTREALDKLSLHNWPGNVRELQHAIEKAVILSSADMLDSIDFLFNNARPGLEGSGSLNLGENEKVLIALAIEKNKGNLSRAARSLGINRSTLYEKIRRYGL